MPILKIYRDSRSFGACRSCGASVEWAELTSGKRHPFDGEIVAVQTQESLVEGRVVELVDTAVTSSHFSSCPDAKAWRRRGRA